MRFVAPQEQGVHATALAAFRKRNTAGFGWSPKRRISPPTWNVAWKRIHLPEGYRGHPSVVTRVQS